MTPDHTDTAATVAVKLAPAGVPATLTFMGIPLPTLVQLAALVYTLVQLGFLLYDRLFKKKEVRYECVPTEAERAAREAR